MKAYPMSATLMDGISVSLSLFSSYGWLRRCSGTVGFGLPGEDGADVTRGDDDEEHAKAGDERRVLRDAAHHGAQQVDAVVARHRRRALDGGSEEEAGAQDRAELEHRVEKRVHRAALEPDPP